DIFSPWNLTILVPVKRVVRRTLRMKIEFILVVPERGSYLIGGIPLSEVEASNRRVSSFLEKRAKVIGIGICREAISLWVCESHDRFIQVDEMDHIRRPMVQL